MSYHDTDLGSLDAALAAIAGLALVIFGWLTKKFRELKA